MDPISEGCRLCLNLFAECFTTIDNPQLKDQMEKVFCFPVEPKQGYYSGVCQSCSYAISDFYQYSETVRQNQEILNGNAANCDPTVDSKIMLENIKIETFRESGHPETRKDACELKDEISGEEVTASNSKSALENIKIETLSDSGLPEGACEQKDGISVEEEVPKSGVDESNESPPKKSRIKRKRWPGNSKLDHLEAGEPTKNEHMGIKVQRVQCRICQRWLKEKNLRAHIDMMHTGGDRKMQCDICLQKYPHAQSLKTHKMFTHGKPRHEYEFCGKKFKRLISLKEHRTAHKGEVLSGAASSVRSSLSVEPASPRRAPVRCPRGTARRIYRTVDQLVALQNSVVSLETVPVPEGVNSITQQMFNDWSSWSMRQPTTFLLYVLSHMYPQDQCLTLSNTRSTLRTIDTDRRNFLSRLLTIYLRRINSPLPGTWRRNDENVHNAVKRFNEEVQEKRLARKRRRQERLGEPSGRHS